MNRNDLVKLALANINNKALNDEIEHFMCIDREESDCEDHDYDLYDALDEAHDLACDINDRKVLTPARKVLIEIGCIKHITDEDLQYIQTFGRGKKYDFILGGKKYVWEKHLLSQDELDGEALIDKHQSEWAGF